MRYEALIHLIKMVRVITFSLLRFSPSMLYAIIFGALNEKQEAEDVTGKIGRAYVINSYICHAKDSEV